MKKRAIVSILALTLTLGVSSLAFASETDKQSEGTKSNTVGVNCGGQGLRAYSGLRGRDYVEKILIEKFNISKDSIDKAQEEGKKLSDVAKENEVTFDEFKEELLKVKFEEIDKLVSEGKITVEKGNEIKENMKNNMASREDFNTGNKGNGKGKCGNMGAGRSQGKGQGNGQGNGNCKAN